MAGLHEVGLPGLSLLGNKRRVARGGDIHPPMGLSGMAATINKPASLVRTSEGSVGAR